MSTKNKQHRRRRATRSAPGHPCRPAARSAGTAQIRALEPRYIRWRARSVPADQAADEWHRIAALLDLYAAEHLFESPDALEARALVSLMDTAFHAFPGSAKSLIGLVDRYLHFLAETGHWKRSQGELSAVHVLFRFGEPPLCQRSPLRQGGVVITNPRELPLVCWAAAVIRGLGGPGAGCLSMAANIGDLISEVAALESMAAVARPRMAELVHAMMLAELISFNGQRAQPTPAGNHLVEMRGKGFADAVRRLAEAYVTCLLLEAAGIMRDTRTPEHALMLAAFLTHVSGAGPIPVLVLEIDWRTNHVDGSREIADWLDPLEPGILACLESGLLGSAHGNLVAPPFARKVFDTVQARFLGQLPQPQNEAAP